MNTLLTWICLASVGWTLSEAAAAPPNVVPIFADDLGYGDLSCYGATKVQTPHIDRLAAEGRRFTDAHSASAVCTPSRYALVTGEYPHRKGLSRPVFLRTGLVIDTKQQTIASIMKDAGYATACIGKWHLGFGERAPDWNGDLLGFKFSAWEGGHRVPFIARWPGKIEEGSTSEQLISNIDLPATLAALTGGTIKKGQARDSVNVLPALTTKPTEPLRDHLVLAASKGTHLAIRKDKWMYIGAKGGGGFTAAKRGAHAFGGPAALHFAKRENSDIENGKIKKDAPPAQLYDLEEDLAQTTNLYRQHPEVVKEMSDLLKQYRVPAKARPRRKKPANAAPARKKPVKAVPARSAKLQGPPNFVVIFSDDQGYADLGCFGSPEIRTPRLDAMASDGMKFTSFYAQPVCGPSRAALMTGCYPMRVAERGNVKQVHPVLHSDEITVAEVLKAKGYATACFGKWDLAKHAQEGFFMDLFPTRQGFDYFYGTPTSNDRVANLYRNEKRIEPKTDMATLTRRYTDEAIGFMKKNRDKPFFVYLPHSMPHTRLDASGQFKGKSKRGLYGDVIEEIDFNVGRILDAISEMGLRESTYVLFTSDNGPWLIKNKDHADGALPGDHGGSAGPLRSGKVSTFEGGVRVPAILWGAKRIPAGATCDKIASTMDVLPTLAALAGAQAPSDRVIDGEDISHLFHGDFEKADPNKTHYYYLRVHLQAVRQGQWKLHLPRDKEPVGAAPFSRNTHIAPADRVGFDQPFLVDLQSDLGETTNVADQNPQVVKRLLALAEGMRDDLGDYDRVGKNMRFFDLTGDRPSEPPVPQARKRVRKPKAKTEKK